MSEKNIIILDGDEIAYNCAVIGEERSIKATHNPSGRSKEFKNRTEFREFIKDKFDEELFTVQDIQKATEFKFVRSLINKYTSNMLGRLNADRSEIYISGDANFRLALPTKVLYKSNRQFAVRPVHLSAAKAYLISKGAVKVQDREADDMLAQRMYDGYLANKKIIGVTVDKDARMNPGWLLNPDTKDTEPVFIEGFGSISLEETKNSTKVKAYGRLQLYLQLLTGDSTDCYNPRDWLEQTTRYGEKTAYKALLETTNDAEAIECIAKQYKSWYPKPFSFVDCHGALHTDFTWVDCLQTIADCAYMRRSDTDRWDARKILKAALGENYA